jgi:hypothetical protein
MTEQQRETMMGAIKSQPYWVVCWKNHILWCGDCAEARAVCAEYRLRFREQYARQQPSVQQRMQQFLGEWGLG